VHVYTVNDPVDGKRMLEAGVDGITTDKPAFMKKTLGLE
jgi:glycerophosphoryl diester phosphodiesterase